MIVGKSLDGLPSGAKQDIIQDARMSPGIRVPDIWDGKYQMKIGNWKQFLFTGIDPLFSLCILTLWAVSVTTRVVRDLQVAAGRAGINMAPERMGTAVSEGS